jgi:hypothetical protein
MNARKQIRIFMTLVFWLVTVWAIGVTQVAKASNLLPTGTLAAGEVIDNDVFAHGPQVTIDGTINGDVFIIGNQVQVNGTINGSLFIMGQNVVVQGKVSGTTYTAAVALELKPETELQHNLYFAGVSLTTLPNSAIQRDLRTICLSADLKGEVIRDTRATIGILKLIELIINRLGGEYPVPQSILQPGGVVTLGTGAGLIFSPITFWLQASPTVSEIDTGVLISWLEDRLRDLGVLLVLGAVFYWLFRDPLNRVSQSLHLRPLAALGYGLLALLITANIFLVGVLVASLIFVIGLWLGFLGLWSFTLALWALTYAALAFFLVALWFLVAYGTKLIVAYLVGVWLFEKIIPKINIPRFVALAIGVLIYVLLRSIPMLGWVISVLVTAWGLGAFWLAYRESDGKHDPNLQTTIQS